MNSGRTDARVVIAVGRHMRIPRTYRGRDIMWWLDRIGVLADTADSVFDRAASQAQPSFQLVGRPDRASLSLADLQDAGVVIAGRLNAVEGSVAQFDDNLIATTVAADAKLAKLLQRIETYAVECGMDTDRGRTIYATLASIRERAFPARHRSRGAWHHDDPVGDWLPARLPVARRAGRARRRAGKSAMSAASFRSQASTSSDCPSCIAGTRPSSTASGTTPWCWPST